MSGEFKHPLVIIAGVFHLRPILPELKFHAFGKYIGTVFQGFVGTRQLRQFQPSSQERMRLDSEEVVCARFCDFAETVQLAAQCLVHTVQEDIIERFACTHLPQCENPVVDSHGKIEAVVVLRIKETMIMFFQEQAIVVDEFSGTFRITLFTCQDVCPAERFEHEETVQLGNPFLMFFLTAEPVDSVLAHEDWFFIIKVNESLCDFVCLLQNFFTFRSRYGCRRPLFFGFSPFDLVITRIEVFRLHSCNEFCAAKSVSQKNDG